jgi:hypothetical protein
MYLFVWGKRYIRKYLTEFKKRKRACCLLTTNPFSEAKKPQLQHLGYHILQVISSTDHNFGPVWFLDPAPSLSPSKDLAITFSFLAAGHR